MRIRRSSRVTRWLAGALGVGVAAAVVVLIAAPAGAATTVPAQLALTGVVTDKSPTGGSVVGVHPGDSVDFKAAPAAVSTQGLNALGVPLGDLVGSLLGQVVGYQVVMHLPSTFPGGKRDVKLGPCGGQSDFKATFSKAGSYSFSWSAYSVTVLPLVGTCSLNNLKLNGNELAQAGVSLNASNQWAGKVVAATTPPPGGLSVQLPGVSAAPKVGPVQAPTVGVPGANLPTVPVTQPSAPAPSPTPSASTPGSGGLHYTPPGTSVQDKVVPKGYGSDGSDSTNGDANSHLRSALLSGPAAAIGPNATNGPGATAGPGVNASPAPTRSAQPINLAANKAPAGQMPVLLAILAIIALSLVTATYARLYLLRRNVS
jgi:hypothetical protein